MSQRRHQWWTPAELVFMKFFLLPSLTCSYAGLSKLRLLREIAGNLMICDCYILTIIDGASTNNSLREQREQTLMPR